MRRESTTKWVNEGTLSRKSGQAAENLGMGLASGEGVIAAGAPSAGDKGNHVGAVVVFEKNAKGAWIEAATLYPAYTANANPPRNVRPTTRASAGRVLGCVHRRF